MTDYFDSEMQREVENAVARIRVAAQREIENVATSIRVLAHRKAKMIFYGTQAAGRRHDTELKHSYGHEAPASPRLQVAPTATAPQANEAVGRQGAQTAYNHVPEPGAETAPITDRAAHRLAVMLLSERCSLALVIQRFKHKHPDPVSVLCAFLKKTVPHNTEWRRLEREPQRAVEVLVTLGAVAGLSYLIKHISLLCWEQSEPLAALVRPHHAAFTAAAVNVWPDLTWTERVTLVLLFKDCNVSATPLIDLICATAPSELTCEDRHRFVDVLEFTESPRVASILRTLLDRSITEVSSTPSAAATELLHRIMKALATQGGPTPEHLRRAAQLGICFETPNHEPRQRPNSPLAEKAPVAQAPAELMVFINENPGCTTADIRRRLAIPEWKLNQHLRVLQGSGFLRVELGTTPHNGRRKHRLFYSAGNTNQHPTPDAALATEA